MRNTDPQRQAVYDWEREYVMGDQAVERGSMTLDECQALVDRIYADKRVENAGYHGLAPKVRAARRRRTVRQCNSDDAGAYPITQVTWTNGRQVSMKRYYRVVLADYPRVSACYRALTHTITLPAWARQKSVVLHETAHSMDSALESHGPVFMRKYIDLLVQYDVFTEHELIDSAAHYNLRIAEKGN